MLVCTLHFFSFSLVVTCFSKCVTVFLWSKLSLLTHRAVLSCLLFLRTFQSFIWVILCWKPLTAAQLPHITLATQNTKKSRRPTPQFLCVSPFLSPLSFLKGWLHTMQRQKKEIKIADFFPHLSVWVCNVFGDKDPCCRESCGKGVRPEDVSALASDNVSWRDTACHFTEPHIKKDRGGKERGEDSMSFVCFDTRSRKGLQGKAPQMHVCVFVGRVCLHVRHVMGRRVRIFLGYFLDMFCKITLKQIQIKTDSSVMSGFLLHVP